MRGLTLLILFLVTIGYLCIGAAVFQALESQNEQDTKVYTGDLFRKFLEKAECINQDQLEELLKGVIAAYDQGVVVMNKTQSADNWNFASSFFFSATVVTTIGYGHISPSTVRGRGFCIAYAVLGIPLIGVFLAGLGQKIHKPFKTIKEKVFCKRHKKIEKLLKSILVPVLGFCILLLLPAIGFHNNEGWTFFEAFYYGVITLTTIGFGDFVAGQNDDDLRPLYQVGIIVWIFVGLSLFSAILADVSDYYNEQVTQTEDKWKEKYQVDESKSPGPVMLSERL